MPQTVQHVEAVITDSEADGGRQERLFWNDCQVRAKSPGWLAVQPLGEDTFSSHPGQHDWSLGYQLIDEHGQIAGDLKGVCEGAGDRGELIQFIVVCQLRKDEV